MKQSPATGMFLTRVTILSFTFIFLFTACTRLPRSNTSNATAVTAPHSEATINLNAASAAELERLPGIGPVLAERIITYRQTNGRFRRAEHLMMVRGISDRKFRELRSMIRVE